MAPPNDAPVFGDTIHLVATQTQALGLSDTLADWLSAAREGYVWKATTAKESQGNIIRLEQEVGRRLTKLDGANAQWICREVSRWGGNNEKALRTLANSPSEQNCKFAKLISQLLVPASVKDALHELAGQSGLNLVMASKVYRFCSPKFGAAVDRHSSYFFNSLHMQVEGGQLRACTRFVRQWADGKHQSSRLDIYSSGSKGEANLHEYCDIYLPLLRRLADALDSKRGGFLCAASGERRAWRPADVEMAAYFWWSQNSRYR
jgi:hypothetical protein